MEDMIVIDAENTIAGRLASRIVSELKKGKKINVVNAEKAVVSGNPEHVIKIYSEKVERGDPYHGPFYPKHPDRILKRMVRGMLPYKKASGMDALKRLKVFISIPDELKNQKPLKIKDVENKLEFKHITLGKLAEKLGEKKTW